MRFPVTVVIKPSRRLRVALVFVHALAAFALAVAAIPPVAALAGVLLIATSLVGACRLPPPLVYRLGDDGALDRLDADGEPSRLEILPGGWVVGWLAAIRVREAGGRDRRRMTTLLVLSDSLAPSAFRALRLWLRWRAKFSQRGVVA